MSRVHDMGGRFGTGPVRPSPEDAPVFAKDWHARALGVTVAAGALGRWNIDRSRHARECLPPGDYMRFSYYEKWIAALADLCVEAGLLTRQELATGQAAAQAEGAAPPDRARMAQILAAGGPARREGGPPALFAPGDAVRSRRPARNLAVRGGHTRLPAYAAGACGRVLVHHGSHVLPDANAHGLGEAPEPLYAVAFAAGELWGPEAVEDPADEVVLDLWQSYLEPA